MTTLIELFDLGTEVQLNTAQLFTIDLGTPRGRLPSGSSPAFPEGSLLVSISEDLSIDAEVLLLADCRVKSFGTCPNCVSGGRGL